MRWIAHLSRAGAAALTAFALSGCATVARLQSHAAPSPSPIASPQAAAQSPQPLAAAYKLEQRKQWAAARAVYEAALVDSPNDAVCLHRLAVVCTEQREHAVAVNYYNRAITLAPRDCDLFADAGYACYLRGEYAAAEALLRHALTCLPGHARATNNLGLVLGAAGQTDAALAAFRQVNTPVNAWRNLAHVYQRRSDPPGALACYEEMRKLDPSIQIPTTLVARRAVAPLTPPALPPSPAPPVAEPITVPSPAPIVMTSVEVPATVPAVGFTDVSDLHFELPQSVDAQPLDTSAPRLLPASSRSASTDDEFGPFELPIQKSAEPATVPEPTAARMPSPSLRSVTAPVISPGWPVQPPAPAVLTSITITPGAIAARPELHSAALPTVVYTRAEIVPSTRSAD